MTKQYINEYFYFIKESAGQLMIADDTSEYIYVDECTINTSEVLDCKKKFVFFIRDPIYRAYAGIRTFDIRHIFNVALIYNYITTTNTLYYDACLKTILALLTP